METEIFRWFTDDSDFCVSLLLYLLPRELGAYFLPHHGYKKYQQKPQECNFSTFLLKMANKLNVSYTKETGVLSVMVVSVQHQEAKLLFYVFTNYFSTAFLMQGIFNKEPKMSV